MDYAKYKNVRNASWQCLLDCNIRLLPVPIGSICRIYDIDVIDDDNNYLNANESGRIVKINSEIAIVVNNTEHGVLLCCMILLGIWRHEDGENILLTRQRIYGNILLDF